MRPNDLSGIDEARKDPLNAPPVNTGGPAFPLVCADIGVQQGMTLRDYFAANVMQGMATNLSMNNLLATLPYDRKKQQRQMADMTYEMADAMIAARGQQ